MEYENLSEQYKQRELQGRYIAPVHIAPLLAQKPTQEHLSVFGQSVLHKPIFAYRIGSGKVRILCWSQMHGNESTTTKALFDLFLFLQGGTAEAERFLQHFSFFIIPMLNPDGAESYTRENANGVDLNRDAQSLSQPESVVLRKAYDDFDPHYCFNMHDQRTIFGVADSGKPATISFLSPSFDADRGMNAVRLEAIRVIVGMDKVLQRYIPGQVGRFDDAFNINCIGDTFQQAGTPTILIEAGHYADDYEREASRKYVFIALLAALNSIYENVIVGNENEYYMHIPQNNANFFDFVYKNINIHYDNSEIITTFAAQYVEQLIDNSVHFNAFITKIGDLEQYFGHIEIDAKAQRYSDNGNNIPVLNQKADFRIGNNIEVSNGKIR